MDEATHVPSSVTRPNLQRALVLINAKSRQGRDNAETARKLLEERGFEVNAPSVDSPAEFSDIIREERWDTDIVIVGGGDGSIRCALEGVVSTGLPLGVLPLGTANNLARNLAIPTDLAQACDLLLQAPRRSVDLGEVNGILFLNVAGLGLSTQINRHVPADLKKKWGALAYVWYAFKIIRRTRPFRAMISCDGQLARLKTLQITVCNGRHYGNGLTIAADATIDDGHLDLACIEAMEWWQGLRVLPTLWHGRGGDKPGFMRLRGKEILIETRKPLAIDTDGDVMTHTPARFRIHRDALTVIAPPVASVEQSTQNVSSVRPVLKQEPPLVQF